MFHKLLKIAPFLAIGLCFLFIFRALHVGHLAIKPSLPLHEMDVIFMPEEDNDTFTAAQEDTRKPQIMLVILAYMRSGSSFTGDIIQRSLDVFYVSEPLWSIKRIMEGPMKPVYIEKKKSSKDKWSRETVENFLTCNVKDVDLLTLTQKHMLRSLDTQLYYDCISEKEGLLGTLDCLPLLERPCRESRMSCVKTTRFDMRDVPYLMEKYPELKIIHLMRDPRSTLLSQRLAMQFEWKDLNETATKLCSRFENNIKDSEKMAAVYKERIATLRYEDLVADPDFVVEQIYSFLGLDLTAQIKDYVYRRTTVTKTNCGALCPNRNSTIVAKWQRQLPFEYVTMIDNACKNVYLKLGYQSVKDETNLKNLTVPVYGDVPDEMTHSSS